MSYTGSRLVTNKQTNKQTDKLELYRAHTPRAAVSTTFTYILCQVVRMSRKHMVGSVHRRGQQNAKMQYLRCLWTLPNDSKHNEASFSTISTDTLYLRVAQMPRSPDPAIFVLTTDTTDHFTPCACARGNKQTTVTLVRMRAER